VHSLSRRAGDVKNARRMPDPLREDRAFHVVAACTLGALGVYVAWVATTFGKSGLYALLWLVGTLPFVGKFLIFAGLANHPLGPIAIAVFSLLFDLLVAVILFAGLHRFERLPVAGAGITAARRRAHEVLERYPGLRRLAFWGVSLFVFLPLPASGAVGGSFAATLFGLSRASGVLGIGLGSGAIAVVFTAIAIGMGKEGEALLKNPWLGVAGLAVFALFGWLAYRRAKKILERG
jgi:uncharacterized membrane protein